MTFNHLFDSSALLHRFNIENGHVTYQCRFLKSDAYKKNKAAQRIVVTEFGTSAAPDPCHTIFHRWFSLVRQKVSSADFVSFLAESLQSSASLVRTFRIMR